MQHNLNTYAESDFQQWFVKQPLYNELRNDFDIVLFDDHFTHGMRKYTPRQRFGSSICSAVPFYFLNFLTEKNPKTIYDLGCGWNIFKRYIPNIIGIGAEDPISDVFYADIHDYVDDDFFAGHQEFFESVFSINSLHYISLSALPKRVYDFGSMIKKGGRGFLSLNLTVLQLNDDHFRDAPLDHIDQWVRKELADMPFNYLVFDLNHSKYGENNTVDGNFRIVIEK